MFRSKSSRLANASLVRAFVFGVEDSVVSTVGLLSGVAVGNMPRSSIILAGVVLIFVEAFSMGAGQFLSESSAEDFEHKKGTFHSGAILQGIIMFFSYFVAGCFVISPYFLFPVDQAFWLSIGASLLALLFLGIGNARLSGVSMIKSAFRMCVIGGLALAVGIIAAIIFKDFN